MVEQQLTLTSFVKAITLLPIVKDLLQKAINVGIESEYGT